MGHFWQNEAQYILLAKFCHKFDSHQVLGRKICPIAIDVLAADGHGDGDGHAVQIGIVGFGDVVDDDAIVDLVGVLLDVGETPVVGQALSRQFAL